MTGSAVRAERAAGPQTTRIAALDVARGFALLGIFLVNIDFFALPFGVVGDPGRPAPDSPLEFLLFWLVRIFCEQRFYPLFSLLFGMGVILQRSSLLARGADFAPIYLRRTCLLIGIGAVHGLFFWYGDILLTYGVLALVMLPLSALSGRQLGLATLLCFALSVVVLVPLQALQALQTLQPSVRSEASRHAIGEESGRSTDLSTDISTDLSIGPPFDQLVAGLLEGDIELLGKRWSELETRAYRDGGSLQSFGFRLVSWLLVSVSTLMGGFTTILTMFLLGATVVKLDGLGEREAWLLRALPFLVCFGIPFSVLAALVEHAAPPIWGMPLGQLMTIVAGIVMALLYFGICQWCSHLRAPLLQAAMRPLAAAGRMALTNYLAQTLIATFVMYHWGLGLFGQTTLSFRLSLVAVVWLFQVMASALWLRSFRFGPCEWLWRSATYLELQPMRRV